MRKQRVNQLAQLAITARVMGFKVRPSTNAGGWLELARSCGAIVETKAEARAALRGLLHVGSASGTRPAPPAKKTDNFLASFEWRRLRMSVIKKYGRRCMCCGAGPESGAVVNVDHIKPRKLFPELALDFDNLQILCHECNHGKGNWDQTDWRPPAKGKL